MLSGICFWRVLLPEKFVNERGGYLGCSGFFDRHHVASDRPMLLIANSAGSSQKATGKNGLVAAGSVVTILWRLRLAACPLCVGGVSRLLAACGSPIRVN